MFPERQLNEDDYFHSADVQIGIYIIITSTSHARLSHDGQGRMRSVKNPQELIREIEEYIAMIPIDQTARNTMFILSQPAALQIGYAANPNLAELTNKWLLDNLTRHMRLVFDGYGVVSISIEKFINDLSHAM